MRSTPSRATLLDRVLRTRRTEWLVATAVLSLAALAWGLVLDQAERSVFARVPLLDEVYYLDRAAEVSAPGGAPDAPYFMSPLYPRLIAAVGAAPPPDGGARSDRLVDGSQLRPLRLLQIACWFGVVILLRLAAGEMFLGRRRYDRSGQAPTARWRLLAWLPSVLFALYLPAAVYSLAVMLELPLAVTLTTVVWLLTRVWLRRDAAEFPATGSPYVVPVLAGIVGLLLGTAGLFRGTSLVLWPVAAWVFWRAGGSRRRRGGTVAALLAGLLVALLPAAAHNTRLAGHPVGPTLNGGVNLYIGNGPEANGFYVAAVPGDWRSDPAGQAFLARRFGRDAVDLAEADRFWARAALDALAADPLRGVGLYLKKIWLFLQVAEIDQLTPLQGWVAEAGRLQVFCLPFALIVIPGLTGLLLAFGERSAARLWGFLLVALLLGQSVFFVVSRYRLALVPLLALLAAAAVAEVGRRRRRPWPVAVIVVVALAVQPWGLDHLSRTWPSLALANEARRWVIVAERSDPAGEALARAEALYDRSLDGAPDNTAAWLGLAAIRSAAGDGAGTEAVLRRGLARLPGEPRLLERLAALLLQQHRYDEALDVVTAQLAVDPADRDAGHNHVVLLMGAGRIEEAEAAARHLLAVDPDDPRAYLDLGVVLARSGRPAEARDVFREGLRRHPEHAELAHNLRVAADP